MRYLSLFSGVEAASVAWEPLGWEAVAFAEFDAFPSEVLAQRFPEIKNLGDVRNIGKETLSELGEFDLVVGGSPCQNLSVAGNREGLQGEESSLFLEQMRIFELAREINGARYLLWENVPGAFSTNGGEDFRVVLETMVGRLPRNTDGWGTAGVVLSRDWDRIVEWRTLDAQYFGVPQRRRRIFALLDTGAWWSREPILFERESSEWNIEAGESTKEEPARTVEEGAGVYCLQGSMIGRKERNGPQGSGVNEDVAFTLNTTDRHVVAYENHANDSRIKEVDVFQTLSSRMGTGGGNVPLVQELVQETPIVFLERAGKPGGGKGLLTSEDKTFTLGTTMIQSVCMQEAYSIAPYESGGNFPINVKKVDSTRAIDTSNQSPGKNQGGMAILEETATVSTVRRLTPKECERLQGFPDDWTNVKWNGRHPAPDSHRYKAMGNSMAVPVMRWIGERIDLSKEGV